MRSPSRSPTGDRRAARSRASIRDGDLAVIAVDTTGATPLEWGAPESASVGTPVFGAAATLGGGAASRSASSRRSPARSAGRAAGASPAASSTPRRSRPVRPAARCSTPTAGSIGLNTNRIGEGFYLALPADAATPRAGRVAGPRRVAVERPRLGVAIAPNHVARRLRRSVGLPERDGVLVRGVEDGSPAAAAGIEAGDLIVSAGGSAIADADDLHDALGTLKPPFDVVIVRGADEKTLTVQLRSRSERPATPRGRPLQT